MGTGPTGGTGPNRTIWTNDSPLSTVNINCTGPTQNLDIVFTGWQNNSEGIGMMVKNGSTVNIGDRVWFTDLTYGIVSNRSNVTLPESGSI